MLSLTHDTDPAAPLPDAYHGGVAMHPTTKGALLMSSEAEIVIAKKSTILDLIILFEKEKEKTYTSEEIVDMLKAYAIALDS